jgi:hypothetical protein
MDQFAQINKYHVQMLERFVSRLAADQDGDGSLLDHSMMSLRQQHEQRQPARSRPLPSDSRRRAPRGSCRATGTSAEGQTTMSNLLLAMLDKLGVHRTASATAPGRLEISETTRIRVARNESHDQLGGSEEITHRGAPQEETPSRI